MSTSSAAEPLRVLVVAELAQRWRTTSWTIHRMIASGDLPGAFKVRGTWRIPLEDIARVEHVDRKIEP